LIVLDTNVLSELWRPRPSADALRWLRAQPAAALFTTAINEAEIFYGIELLSHSKRRRELELLARTIFGQDFMGRVLPFDSAAAREYAQIAATQSRAGRPMSQADAQIAAIARSRGAAIATRNLADFADCGLRVLSPWDH
jgi:predicted nucleic acid-binding protein